MMNVCNSGSKVAASCLSAFIFNFISLALFWPQSTALLLTRGKGKSVIITICILCDAYFSINFAAYGNYSCFSPKNFWPCRRRRRRRRGRPLSRHRWSNDLDGHTLRMGNCENCTERVQGRRVVAGSNSCSALLCALLCNYYFTWCSHCLEIVR